MATLFTGRTFEIEIFPFSFEEYLKYYQCEDIDLAFDKYVLNGGMAGSYLYDNEEKRYNYYILDVYKRIL